MLIKGKSPGRCYSQDKLYGSAPPVACRCVFGGAGDEIRLHDKVIGVYLLPYDICYITCFSWSCCTGMSCGITSSWRRGVSPAWRTWGRDGSGRGGRLGSWWSWGARALPGARMARPRFVRRSWYGWASRLQVNAHGSSWLASRRDPPEQFMWDSGILVRILYKHFFMC